VISLVDRTARLLLVLAILPAVLLGTVSVEAILIHDHHGQDLHFHTITLDDPADRLESWHCEHEPDRHASDPPPNRQASDPPKENCRTIMIVLELPDALPRVRGLSTRTVVTTGSARFLVHAAVSPDSAASGPSLYARSWSAAPDLRAGSGVAGILLTNHALLL
jgi:hypothetical protein